MSWTEAIAQASPRSNGRVPEARIPAGSRNSELASLAGVMREAGMSEGSMAAALIAENRRRCDPPLDDDEVRKIAASYGKYPAGAVMHLVTDSTPDGAPPSTVRAALEWPDPLSAAAYHGPLGAMVRAVEEHTEADPVGILGTLLTDVACLLGDARTIHQGAWHAPRLFTVLVGDTASGRKGTATSLSRDILRLIEPDYYRLLIAGLGSGEGLVNRLRRLKADGGTEHRALVMDSEFGRLLAVMSREGSTLSPILRDAWDGAPLGRTLARQDDLIHEHHVCLMAHVTVRELRARLAGVERDNGFSNRFLWLLVRRQRLVPFPQRRSV